MEPAETWNKERPFEKLCIGHQAVANETGMIGKQVSSIHMPLEAQVQEVHLLLRLLRIIVH